MSFTEDLKTGVHPYRERMSGVLRFVFQYLKNPVQTIRQLPDWDWATLHIFLSASAALGGVLSGFVAVKFGQVLSGLIGFPISVIIWTWIFTGFFYYTFFFMYRRELPLKALFTLLSFSALPFFAIYIISPLVEPLKLIGFAVSAILLSVGLTEMSGLNRNQVIKLIGGIFLAYSLFWVYNMINFKSGSDHDKRLATPESIEKLTEELNQ